MKDTSDILKELDKDIGYVHHYLNDKKGKEYIDKLVDRVHATVSWLVESISGTYLDRLLETDLELENPSKIKAILEAMRESKGLRKSDESVL